ncbi:MAG TPA: DUF86 domain-containing protein [Terriglobia bacterium]|jgi:uncharacterized protein with HEPN domain|nr:DUF86 domain-containing protein [Terriglobia bacterium]
MKHPERVEDYLEPFAQAIERAIQYVEHFGSVVALQQNQQVQDAVIRNIEIIGEAASRIHKQAPEFVMAHPQLPWIEMRGMRNKMIHNYFDVSLTVVWNTIKHDLPRLKQQIDSLLSEYRGGQEE